MHLEARLYATKITLGIATAIPSAAFCQTDAGMQIFQQRCQACHSVIAGKAGPAAPTLAGVMGRKAGNTAFSYSSALRSSGIVWNDANLERFLSNPSQMVPGTRMIVAVPERKDRQALINYLRSLK